ncbi:MAG: SusC/RagA family protein, partial [Rikenellaceae bacterium]
IQLTGSVRTQQAPGSLSRESNTVEGTYDRDFDINPYSYCLNTSRALTAYDEDGNLEYHTRNYAPFNIISELENNKILLNVVDIKVSPELSVKLTDKLRYEFKGAFRYSKSDMEHQITEDSNMAEAYRADYTSTIRANNPYLYTDPDVSNAEPVSVLPYGGFYNRTENSLLNYDIRNSIAYGNEWGKSGLNVFVGQQIKYTNRQEYSSTGYGYQYNYGGVVSTDYQIMKMMIESNFPYFEMYESRSRFAAFYATADYSYDRRYVIAGTTRYDGSNELGMNASSRWLPTWTMSGKWNVTNEQFMQNVNWIDEMSVRVSHGLTADMPTSASASAVYYATSTNRPYTDEIETVIEISSLQNDDLTWEKSYLTNIGIDVGLFNRRLDIVVDYWVRNSFDLIGSFKTSGIGGEMWKYANYADMTSSGLDVMIGGYPIRTKNFSWHSNFTLGLTETLITNVDNTPSIYDLCKAEGGNLEGYPVNSLFSIQFAGLDSNGVPTFIDESGDVAYDAYFQSTSVSYLKYEGSVDPTYTGGWSNTFNYKNLSLNIFLTFQGGNKIRLNPIFSSTYSDLDAMPQVFYDRWVMSGDEQYTNVPSIIDVLLESELDGTYPFNSYNYSTERVADGTFVRLKNVSLTYNVPERILKPLNSVKGVSLTCAASNLALLYADKTLNGQDPEFYNSGGVAQPVSTQITFALNVNF